MKQRHLTHTTLRALLIVTLGIALLLLCGCKKEPPHEHAFSTEYGHEATEHFRVCACGERSEVSEHIYDNACDATCNVCGAERTVGEHTYDNACDKTCNVCGAERTVGEHTYDNACDKTCNVCGAERTVGEHTYDNACDKTCNVCGAERTVGEHIYDNACDATCNVCGAERTVGEHIYDNACDKTCNVCGAERTVGEHTYDNACDTTCNVCGAERTITHTLPQTLTIGADGTHYYLCTICQAEEQKAAHVYDREIVCDEALKSEASATSKPIYYKSCVCGHIDKSDTAATFRSGKINPTVTEVSDSSKTYDGSAITPPTFLTASTGAVTIEYKKQGADDSTYTTILPVAAGAYVVRITIAETEDHTATVGERTFTIGKAETTLTNLQVISKTYDGSPIAAPTYTANQAEGNVTIEYRKAGPTSDYTLTPPTDAGNYLVRVTIAESENYTGQSAEATFSIAPYTFDFDEGIEAELREDGYLYAHMNGANGEYLLFKFRAKAAIDAPDVALSASGVYANADFIDTYFYDRNGNPNGNHEICADALNQTEAWTGFSLTVTELKSKIYAYMAWTGSIYPTFPATNYNVLLRDTMFTSARVSVVAGMERVNNTYVLEITFADPQHTYTGATVELRSKAGATYAVGYTIEEQNAQPAFAEVVLNTVLAGKRRAVVDIHFGMLRLGESIKLVGSDINYVIDEICDENGVALTYATTGDRVAIGLKDVAAADYPATRSVLCNGGRLKTFAAGTSITVTVRFRTRAEGGRNLPAFDNYRPNLHAVGNSDAVVSLSGFTVVIADESVTDRIDGVAYPGDTVTVTMTFSATTYMYDGMTFFLREGGKTVAEGTVTLSAP